jgi:hypothetical protein
VLRVENALCAAVLETTLSIVGGGGGIRIAAALYPRRLYQSTKHKQKRLSNEIREKQSIISLECIYLKVIIGNYVMFSPLPLLPLGKKSYFPIFKF